MKIGLFGISLLSVNYGVTALGLAQLDFLERIAVKNNIKLEYYIFSGDDFNKISEIKKKLNINSKITIQKLINLKSGLKGFSNIANKIKECDIIIDLTYGDSFSDIYGFKNFLLYSIPKLMTIHNDRTLVIGPQTIGPYKNKLVKIISNKILNKATILCVRDEKSLALAQNMTEREDIICLLYTSPSPRD